jgi:spore germination cell wall hydrolase CwlJ-like protein
MADRHDIEILAKTIYGEARGEGEDGRLAVGHVVLNRFKSDRWYGRETIAETARLPWQFSCWNANDPNRAKLEAVDLDDPDYQHCMYAALGAVLGYLPDNTGGATHYYAYDVVERPKWADPAKSAGRINRHEFFEGID